MRLTQAARDRALSLWQAASSFHGCLTPVRELIVLGVEDISFRK